MVRTSRAKAALRLVTVAVLAAVMSPVARTQWRANPLAWMLIAIFGALVLTSLWELLFPGRLLIGPEGLDLRDLCRRRRWSWADAQGFQPTSNRFYRFVGFSGRRGGVDGLNKDWELSPPDLAALLNAARERWFAAGRG